MPASYPSCTLERDAAASGFPDAAYPSESVSIGKTVRWVAFLVSFSVVAVYSLTLMAHGWIPHDEGTLAQSAERTLNGEIPHRDFDADYTGGLTYVHALAFRVFGVNLLSMRVVLLIGFLLFVAAAWVIAARSAGPVYGSLVTLAAAAWSAPNYFAGLPSWYNLFFATIGIAALLRYVDTRRGIWLFLAGLSAGASILFKIVGLYFVAATLLFLLYREQTAPKWRFLTRKNYGLLVLEAVLGAAFLSLIFVILRAHPTWIGFLNLFIPSAAVVGLLLADEWRLGGVATADRVRALAPPVGIFLLGVVVPCALFVLAYAWAGALPDLVRGLVQQTLRQIAVARMDFPVPITLWFAVPLAVLLLAPADRLRTGRVVFAAVLALLLLLLVVGSSTGVYRAVWYSLRPLPTLVTLAGCIFLASTPGRSLPPSKRQELFLLVAVTAVFALVQFPFAAPIYFCYVAPLAILAAASLVSAQGVTGIRSLHVAALVFYLVFAVAFVNRRSVFDLGLRVVPYPANVQLEARRAHIFVPEEEARVYETLVGEIRKKSGGGPIYAGPDSPEVYFLSGASNPTRSFFDFLGDLYGKNDEFLRMLADRKVKVVVVNTLPAFSRRISGDFLESLRARFPRNRRIGKFLLMWRE